MPQTGGFLSRNIIVIGSILLAFVVAAMNQLSPITLIATGEVFVRIIGKDKEVLFDGTLIEGQRKTVNAVDSVEIRYDKGQNLMMERDGQRMGMGRSGVGRSLIQ